MVAHVDGNERQRNGYMRTAAFSSPNLKLNWHRQFFHACVPQGPSRVMISLPNPKGEQETYPTGLCCLSLALALSLWEHLCSLSRSRSHRGCCGSRCGTHARCGHVSADSPPAQLRAGKGCDERRRAGCEEGQEREGRETSHDATGG